MTRVSIPEPHSLFIFNSPINEAHSLEGKHIHYSVSGKHSLSEAFEQLQLARTKMASHNESHGAGEAKGQSEAKPMMDSVKEKATEAMDKASETAQAAKDKAYQTAQQAKDKASETAEAAKQKSQETGQAAGEKAEAAKENTGGVLQQTGEKVKTAAQGAAETVKHTLGLDGAGKEEKH